MSENYRKDATFNELGISSEILERLNKLNFINPTPIQYKSIPIGINGDDLIGIAQTGTGKTLAFTIPMVQRLAGKKTIGLVLLPTRELALQVSETVHKIASVYGMRTTVLIGGAPMFQQTKSLRGKPNIIVATPGRLIDHIEQKNISLANVEIFVLDEADRMLEMGFEQQIKIIFKHISTSKQSILFCATMPHAISKIAEKYMKTPLHIEVAPSGTAGEKIEQEIFIIHHEEKIKLLDKLLEEYKGTIIVFARTKRGAKRISEKINRMGHTSIDIHSDKSQGQRKAALAGFKSGRIRILVATDIASRGIDVENIELVINYDLPEQTEDYVHRIGRTGRAGKSGKAISFATPEQKNDIRLIEKLIRTKINVAQVPELPQRELMPKNEESETEDFSSNQERGSGDRGFGRRKFGDRRGGDRKSGGRSFGDRKPRERSFGEKSFGDRKPRERSFGEKSFGDRKPRERSFGEKSFGDRKPRERSFGEKSFGDRKPRERSFGEKSFGDRKPRERSFGEKSFGDRKPRERSFGERSFGDRKPSGSSFGDRKYGDRKSGGRSFGDRKFGDRKSGGRSFGDRNSRPRNDSFKSDNPQKEKEFLNNTFDKPENQKNTFSKSERHHGDEKKKSFSFDKRKKSFGGGRDRESKFPKKSGSPFDFKKKTFKPKKQF